eukprot:jgi/Tetstr1/462067/TSEL_007137.t1
MAACAEQQQMKALVRRRDAGRRVTEMYETDMFGRRPPAFTHPPLSLRPKQGGAERDTGTASWEEEEEGEGVDRTSPSLAELNGTTVNHKGQTVFTLCAPEVSTKTAFDDARGGTRRVATPSNWRVDRKQAAAMAEARAAEARALLEGMRAPVDIDEQGRLQSSAAGASFRTMSNVNDVPCAERSLGLVATGATGPSIRPASARAAASTRRHSLLGDAAATAFRDVPRCASARPARMSTARGTSALPPQSLPVPAKRPMSAASCPGSVYRRPASSRGARSARSIANSVHSPARKTTMAEVTDANGVAGPAAVCVDYAPPRTPTLASCRRPVVQVLVWGRGDLGQLGNGAASCAPSPEAMESLAGKDVVHVAAGMYNTAFLTADGELFTSGDNEFGQLGTKQVEGSLEPRRVQALEASTIVHVSVGLGHMVAVTDQGSLASWGSAEFGQLGQGGGLGASAHQPRIVRGTRELRFVQVACGACHTLGLTSSGQVYSFGQGTFGQLGHSDDSNSDAPSMLKRLWAVGILQVAAGENHSAALAADGRVFTWGRGKYGQLGLGDFSSQQSPMPVKALSGVPMVQICCGGDHVVALSRKGEVYSWGRGTWGQTGLGSTDNTCLPRKIESLAGQRIQQARPCAPPRSLHPISEALPEMERFARPMSKGAAACGRPAVAAGSRHTALLASSGEVILFGNGEEGQMGLGDGHLVPAVVSPVLLPLPLSAPSAVSTYVIAGGDHSAMVTKQAAGGSFGQSQLSPTEAPLARGVFPMILPNLLDLADAATTRDNVEAPAHAVSAMTQAVEAVFTSPGIMIAGFTHPPTADASHQAGAADLPHGLDLPAIKQVYTSILHTYNSEVVVTLANSCCALLDGCERAASTPNIAPQAEWLKALLIVCQNPVMGDSRHGPAIITRFAAVTAALTAPSQQMLALWMGKMPREDFAVRVVRPVQKQVSRLCTSTSTMRQNRPELLRVMALLDFLHDVNETADGLVNYEEFHNKEVSEFANLRDEYLLSVEQPPARAPIRSLCQVPFVFTPEAKSRILQGEANLQKRHEVTNSSFHALLAGMHPGNFQWMHITVNRENLLEDALNEIIRRPQDLKKPLKVTFMSAGCVEEGLDEGGVTREFFMLLTRELLDVKYGMFTYLPETRTYWFNQASVEPDVNFKLVGIMLGLAIYNSVILDVHLPMVVYKKLLDHHPTFRDLKAAMPELGRGLQQLLDYDGDVESVFMRSFDVEYEFYGEMRTVELVPGGSSIPVTRDNRQQYVDLYAKWVLTDSISRHFSAFAEGFHQVCDGPALRLFRHEELELLVCGLPHLDFEALEKVARYDGGYTKTSPTIVMFWEVLTSLSLELKKNLPTSHTCFNILLLPEYATREKLANRLLLAIENAEGFGLQ